MARDDVFEQSLRKARRKVYYLLNERAKNWSRELSLRLCEVFASRARRRLVEYSNPMDAESFQQIQDLAYSITVVELENGTYSVAIPTDQEGLFMFLEFGTGLVGESNKHPEADEVGWGYGLHRDTYINGGWYFKRFGSRPKSVLPFMPKVEETHISYIDANDVNPVVERRTKTYVSTTQKVRGYMRNGYYVKSYVRKRHNSKTSTYNYTVSKSGTVFSKGIKPTRYIYNTKQEIYELFEYLNRYKRGELTIRDVYKAIDELERRAV